MKFIERVDAIARRIERFVSGNSVADPLYLTNRSAGQKTRLWVLIGVPCLLLALAIGVALSDILGPQAPKAAAEPSPTEVSAKLLPNIGTDLKLERNHAIEVEEVRIEHAGGLHVNGVVRNTTEHDIANAHVVLDLADLSGSQVGAAEANIQGIRAQKTKAFSITIAQPTAAFALVREAGPIR